MRLKTLSNLIYMVKFQKVPMVLIEESVYRCDTIDFDKKSQHNFARIQIEDFSFKAKITCEFNSFYALKVGEVIVKLSSNFCLLGIYFYCKLS